MAKPFTEDVDLEDSVDLESLCLLLLSFVSIQRRHWFGLRLPSEHRDLVVDADSVR